jgi:hypothetical protein
MDELGSRVRFSTEESPANVRLVPFLYGGPRGWETYSIMWATRWAHVLTFLTPGGRGDLKLCLSLLP